MKPEKTITKTETPKVQKPEYSEYERGLIERFRAVPIQQKWQIHSLVRWVSFFGGYKNHENEEWEKHLSKELDAAKLE